MRKVVPIILIAVLAVGGLYYAYVRAHREQGIRGPVLTARFLDESFGYAVILKTPDHRAIVIDPASHDAADALVDMLRVDRVREVTVVVSNPSPERAAALATLGRNFRIAKVIRPELGPATEDWNRQLARAKYQPTGEVVLARGNKVQLARRVTLEALSPVREKAHGSLVFRVRFGDRSILFPGEMRNDGEANLIQLDGDLAADVLAVRGQGRYSGPSLELLSMVRPQVCVISAGHGNRPSAAVMKRLNPSNTGAGLFRTDKDGIIEIVTDGRSIQVTTQGGGP